MQKTQTSGLGGEFDDMGGCRDCWEKEGNFQRRNGVKENEEQDGKLGQQGRIGAELGSQTSEERDGETEQRDRETEQRDRAGNKEREEKGGTLEKGASTGSRPDGQEGLEEGETHE